MKRLKMWIKYWANNDSIFHNSNTDIVIIYEPRRVYFTYLVSCGNAVPISESVMDGEPYTSPHHMRSSDCLDIRNKHLERYQSKSIWKRYYCK